MSSEKREYRLFDFSGGLNSRDAPHLIADNEMSAGQNITVDRLGKASTRAGYAKTHTAELQDDVQGVFVYQKADGTVYHLCVAGGILYSRTSVTAEWSTLASGLDYTAPVEFYVSNDYCYMLNGVDVARRTDGTTVTSVAAIPIGKYAVTLHGRVFVAGVAGYPGRVYFSDRDAEETFQATSWFPADAMTSGDPITGLAKYFDYLMVFRSNSIWRIDVSDEATTANWIYQLIHDRIGCTSHRSIVSATEGYMLFLSDDGVYALAPTAVESYLSVAKVSGKIDPTIETLINKEKAAAGLYRSRYWLAVSDQGRSNNMVLVYDLTLKMWNTPFVNMGLTCFHAYSDVLYAGSSARGYVWQMDYGTNDNGVAIDAWFETKAVAGLDERNRPAYDRKKRWRYVYPDFYNDGPAYTVTISWSVDGLGGTATITAASDVTAWDEFNWDEDVWGAAAVTTSTRNQVGARGKYITLRFTGSVLDEKFTLMGVTIVYVLEERR